MYVKGTPDIEITYKYNEEGIRIEKSIKNLSNNQITTTKYKVQGNKVIEETTVSNNIHYYYDINNSLIGFKHNNKNYYYEKSVLNDIIGIVNDEGSTVVKYTYDAYGNITNIEDTSGINISTKNSYKYKDYYYDTESSYYYLNSRYYNPEVRRFINCDIGIDKDHILGNNLYQYAYNNPINFEDNEGTWPKWLNVKNITKVGIGLAVIAVAAAITVATGGAGAGVAGYIASTVLQGAVTGAVVGAVTGGVIGVAKNRISTGSWKGSVNAFVNGSVDGFSVGAVSGAILGAVSGTVKVAQAAKAWSPGKTYSSGYESMKDHYARHVINDGGRASNIVDYTNDAINFAKQNAEMLKFTVPSRPTMLPGFKMDYPSGKGGWFTPSGKILTFWYN